MASSSSCPTSKPDTVFTTTRCPSQLAIETSDKSIEELCNFFRPEGAVPLVDNQGDTILHFISIYGNVHVLETLIGKGLLSSEDYMQKNARGDTALHEAARFGQIGVALILVREEKHLVCALNNLGETSVFVAVEHGAEEVFNLLAEYQIDCRTARKDGRTILHAAVARKQYYLAHKQDDEGATALLLLAMAPHSFRSGSLFMLRKLGTTFRIFFHISEYIMYLMVPPLFMETKRGSYTDDPHDNEVIIRKIKRSPFIKILLSFPWVKKVSDAKQRHILAVAVTRRIIGDEKLVHNPFIEATKNGIIEIAAEILRVWPDAALNSYDECQRNILLVAAKYKQKYIYENLKRIVVHKKRMLKEIDNDGNTILHLAASGHEIPNYPASVLPFLHILWDVSWYQRVRRDLDPGLRHLQNSMGKTAEGIFIEAHQGLREKTEKATKAAMQGPMVVSALIATASFSALFTIPGGFHQQTGTPLLYGTNKKHDMKLFLFYLWGVLFSSVLSLGALMVIHLAPFHLNDFYFVLPGELLAASTALFYSVCYSFFTILQAYILENSITSSYFAFMLILVGIACIFYVDAAFSLVNHMIEIVFHI